jgi:hypothetical protein
MGLTTRFVITIFIYYKNLALARMCDNTMP